MFLTLAAILLIVSFITSAVLTIVVKKIAVYFNFVSRPSADRFNRSVIPLGGGIAIYTTIVAALAFAILVVYFLIEPGRLDNVLGETVVIHAIGFIEKMPRLLVVVFCITALFALGLVDDKYHLGPFKKLFFQFVIAFIAAAFADVRVEFFIHSRKITALLSTFWIVLIINAFNFLDNMDGASAGIAIITSAILFVAAAMSGQIFVCSMALIFIGSLLGFLVFNFPPAMIFMGDAGSLVVGFIVALLTLRTTYYYQLANDNWYPILMPFIVMAVPLYDFISVSLLRMSQGKSPFVGDTQHFSHRLKRRGLTETQTVLTLYLATLATGLGATFLYQVNLAGAVLIFVQTFLILAIIAIMEGASPKNDI
jgi:UDP-GlcNAc:undecaprenyl-phosphate GlcNAc-1-phosphate transferase